MSVLIENRKAKFEYEIMEKYEAGIGLLGFEVKSLRNKRGSLEGSFVKILGNEPYLINAHIPAYQPKNTPGSYDPYRSRKLLLTKKEIKELIGKEKTRGLTIVPISVYNKGRVIKVLIAVGRGKKKRDKREIIKKRDTEREIKREMSAKG
ncbi:SsrA-binding protein [Candidatus Nomurabacteria bacterium RIFCSPLOWO2_01_FULL_42_20]|uniref:SsrA-binding protein n=1 Tax=Candidatus Nomurabacteria bacterium RIFCSPHIGHO2_01_FULL_42_16 TaxID=1801743 RepID=A0A1F6VLC3_9BACT|nr:MAG: SsrA-binding protein [Candidatus Nomurabacteria bacterium RIFCSPHIGHO2_01_FULL_42_16]OGI91523.1 MAG: SsrA-binding protein [Candidatus Nomurabacteria bacterium RIFCSPLOWO2_01_FULL_42_20]